jgi:integrase
MEATMSFFRHKNTYCWNFRIPGTLRNRIGVGRSLQKRLTTRQSKLAEALADYMTNVAPLLFNLIGANTALSAREVRLLVHNFLRLADTVETRNGIRERGRFLEDDIRAMLGRARREEDTGPTLQQLDSFRRHLKELAAEFDSIGDPRVGKRSARVPLSGVILRFLDECRGSCTRQTYYHRQTILRSVLEIVGDMPIEDVTRRHLRELKEALVRLPAFWERHYPGVPIREILAKPRLHRTMTTYTVNNYLSVVGTLFEWAVVNGYLPSNPARKLKIKIKHIPSQERDKLSTGELKLIFEKSISYSGNRSAIAERKCDIRTYHGFWIPLIGLFTGMRASEIIGLERRDLERVDRIWCFQVRPNAFRTLKSASAERTIPIHPALLRIGIVKSVEGQKLAPRSALWPYLCKVGRYRCGARFSSFWSSYRRTAGVDQHQKSFHSFRHTFINALLERESRAEIVSDITGHGLRDQVFGRYRKRASPDRLLKSIRRLDFGLSLKHLS